MTELLAVIVAFTAITAWSWRSDRSRLPRLAWTLSLLFRLTVVVLLVLAFRGADIAAVFRPRPRPSILLLADESSSMSLRDGRAVSRRHRADKTAALVGANHGIDGARRGFGSDFTDLGQAIRDGARPAPDALVLLSDGNHNQGASPVKAAVSAGIAVHTVGYGPAEPDSRPVISDIAFPDRVEVNEQFDIRAAARGGGPVSTRWTLSEGGRIVARSGNQDRARPVTLSARATGPGPHRYLLTVTQNGETGDQRGLTVVAVRSRINVVWLAITPDWNLRYAAQALAADPAVRLGSYARIGDQWVRTGGAQPVPLDSMLPCDALVVAGADGVAFPPDLEQFIERQVVGKGGGVLVIGGASAKNIILPLTTTGQKLAGSWEVVPERGWRLSGLFGSWDTTLEARIRKGPPMSVSSRLMTADTTVVTLASVRDARDGSIPLWAWRYSGKGRIMQFASADLWKWKLGLSGARRDQAFFDQLMASTMRWLAGRENSAFQAGPERSAFSTADKVSFRGRWLGWDARTGVAARWDVALSGPGGFGRTVTLSDWGSGDYAADFGALLPGTYSYRTTFSMNGRILNQDRGEVFVEPGRDESQDLTQNRELLREIAAATGGRYFDADSMPPDGAWLRDTPVRANNARRGEHLLFAVLMIIGLLALEWIVRRWHGLR